jgi:hypothetical protein
VETEEKIRLKQYVPLRSKGRHRYGSGLRSYWQEGISCSTSNTYICLKSAEKSWTRFALLQTKQIHGHLWHIYSVTVNQVMVATLKLCKSFNILTIWQRYCCLTMEVLQVFNTMFNTMSIILVANQNTVRIPATCHWKTSSSYFIGDRHSLHRYMYIKLHASFNQYHGYFLSKNKSNYQYILLKYKNLNNLQTALFS